MHVGKTLFAQIMEFVPWTSFARIVQRYSGDSGVTLGVLDYLRRLSYHEAWGQVGARKDDAAIECVDESGSYRSGA